MDKRGHASHWPERSRGTDPPFPYQRWPCLHVIGQGLYTLLRLPHAVAFGRGESGVRRKVMTSPVSQRAACATESMRFMESLLVQCVSNWC